MFLPIASQAKTLNPKQPEQREKRERSVTIKTTKKLSDIHVGRSKKELKAQMAFSGYIVHHFQMPQNHWRLLTRHSTCWSNVPSERLRRVCNAARAKFNAHRWLKDLAEKRYEKLYAPKVASCGASVAACAWYWDGATQCEVDHEGAFTSVSPGGDYAGRFQMDSDFERGSPLGAAMQAKYGRANNWPPGAQIEHAHTVWLSRGWGPWPPYYKYGCAAYYGRSYP